MQNEQIYKYRLKLAKNKELRFISHLDWQNLILKVFRRLELNLVLSNGFNKKPKVSYSPALPIFFESECELVNFQTYEPIKEDFIQKFEENSSNGVKILDLKVIDDDNSEPKSLENYLQWAEYEARYDFLKNHVYNLEKIRYIIEKCISSDELLIKKKSKKGIEKTINYRNSLKSIEIDDKGVISFILKVGQNEDVPALRADEFLKTIFGDSNIFKIKRVKFFDTDLRVI